MPSPVSLLLAMKLAEVARVIAAVALGACSAPQERCSPRTLTPTGDISQDILGVWGWFGIDSPVVAQFRDAGRMSLIELLPGSASQVTDEVSWHVVDAGIAAVAQYGEARISPDGAMLLDNSGSMKRPMTCAGLDP